MNTLITATSNSATEEQSRFCADLDVWTKKCREEIIVDLFEAPAREVLNRFFAGGKMLRGRLVFVAASAVGGNAANALPVAEAIELLHGASLVHDDIIDQSAERRGAPAIHVQLGTELALTIGDYLLLRTFAVLARASSTIGPELTLRVLKAFSNEGQKCCRGEFTELAEKIDSEEAYLSMVQRKTGSLFALAATTGALVGGAQAAEIEALRVFGDQFGTAFQIADDAVDLFSENGASRNSISKSFLKVEDVIAIHKGHVTAARDALKALPPSPAREMLETLVEECRASSIKTVGEGI